MNRNGVDKLEQYGTYQAGMAEMKAFMLHNIGNAITGISHRVEKIDREADALIATSNQLKNILHQEKILTEPDETLALWNKVVKTLKEVGEAGLKDNIIPVQRGMKYIGEMIEQQQKGPGMSLKAVTFEWDDLILDAISLKKTSLDKHGIDIRVQSNVGLVHLPRNPVLQLLINLIKNSREAINKSQEGTEGKESRGIQLISKRISDSSFETVVSDNGCGIKSERLEKIFRAGETDKKSGTGLGLAFSNKFIQSIGGSVRAESRGIGRGASFIITLPLEFKL